MPLMTTLASAFWATVTPISKPTDRAKRFRQVMTNSFRKAGDQIRTIEVRTRRFARCEGGRSEGYAYR
ncbi:hypothetical protein Pfra02_11650 [Pseudomonas fragi]|nr:hypothetical protein Pfra02_11650 [Pseudomonas fragi]